MTPGACSLEGKVALVTGATSGVGRAIARDWAASGARVVATGRRAELGESLVQEVQQARGCLRFVRADVRSSSDCV